MSLTIPTTTTTTVTEGSLDLPHPEAPADRIHARPIASRRSLINDGYLLLFLLHRFLEKNAHESMGIASA